MLFVVVRRCLLCVVYWVLFAVCRCCCFGVRCCLLLSGVAVRCRSLLFVVVCGLTLVVCV